MHRLDEARRLVAAGLSVLPISRDGSKVPAGWLLPKALDEQTGELTSTWKPYQMRRPTDAELLQWFKRTVVGIGVIGGQVSGSLEILDFDEDATTIFAAWSRMVEELSPGLVARLPLIQTPSDGRHVYSRCPTIAGNLKLAQRLGADGRPQTTIETRGEGGYVIAPGSPLACHPLRRPYVLLRGVLAAIPTITPEERTLLLNAARSFNEYVKPERVLSGGDAAARGPVAGERPGDRFNACADWLEILGPHGWTRVGGRGEVTLWKRPGKREQGCSATTNYAASGLLYVFSTNACPFEPETAYGKFAAYALLEHGGDFHAAAKALAAKGYGEKTTKSRSWRVARAERLRGEAEDTARQILAKRRGRIAR